MMDEINPIWRIKKQGASTIMKGPVISDFRYPTEHGLALIREEGNQEFYGDDVDYTHIGNPSNTMSGDGHATMEDDDYNDNDVVLTSGNDAVDDVIHNFEVKDPNGVFTPQEKQDLTNMLQKSFFSFIPQLKGVAANIAKEFKENPSGALSAVKEASKSVTQQGKDAIKPLSKDGLAYITEAAKKGIFQADSLSANAKTILEPLMQDALKIFGQVARTLTTEIGPQLTQVAIQLVSQILKALFAILIPLVTNVIIAAVVARKMPAFHSGLHATLNDPKLLRVAAGIPGKFSNDYITVNNPKGKIIPELLDASVEMNSVMAWMPEPEKHMDRLLVGAYMHYGVSGGKKPKTSKRRQIDVLKSMIRMHTGNDLFDDIKKGKTLKKVDTNTVDTNTKPSPNEKQQIVDLSYMLQQGVLANYAAMHGSEESSSSDNEEWDSGDTGTIYDKKTKTETTPELSNSIKTVPFMHKSSNGVQSVPPPLIPDDLPPTPISSDSESQAPTPISSDSEDIPSVPNDMDEVLPFESEDKSPDVFNDGTESEEDTSSEDESEEDESEEDESDSDKEAPAIPEYTPLLPPPPIPQTYVKPANKGMAPSSLFTPSNDQNDDAENLLPAIFKQNKNTPSAIFKQQNDQFKKDVLLDANHPLTSAKPNPTQTTITPVQLFEEVLKLPDSEALVKKLVKNHVQLDASDVNDTSKLVNTTELSDVITNIMHTPYSDPEIKNRKILDAIQNIVGRVVKFNGGMMGQAAKEWIKMAGTVSGVLSDAISSEAGQEFMKEALESSKGATVSITKDVSKGLYNKMDQKDQSAFNGLVQMFNKDPLASHSTGSILHATYTDPNFTKFVKNGGVYETDHVRIKADAGSPQLKTLAKMQKTYNNSKALQIACHLNWLPSSSHCESLAHVFRTMDIENAQLMAHITAAAVFTKLKKISSRNVIIHNICAGMCTIFKNVTRYFPEDRANFHTEAHNFVNSLVKDSVRVKSLAPFSEKLEQNDAADLFAEELIAASASSLSAWEGITKKWMSISALEFVYEFICAFLHAKDKTLAADVAQSVTKYCLETPNQDWTGMSLLEALLKPDETHYTEFARRSHRNTSPHRVLMVEDQPWFEDSVAIRSRHSRTPVVMYGNGTIEYE